MRAEIIELTKLATRRQSAFGEFLVEQNVIDRFQLFRALQMQDRVQAICAEGSVAELNVARVRRAAAVLPAVQGAAHVMAELRVVQGPAHVMAELRVVQGPAHARAALRVVPALACVMEQVRAVLAPTGAASVPRVMGQVRAVLVPTDAVAERRDVPASAGVASVPRVGPAWTGATRARTEMVASATARARCAVARA